MKKNGAKAPEEEFTMKNTTKQVLILDHVASPYVHQAILILKNYDPSLEEDVIREAEQIVSRYLSRHTLLSGKKAKPVLPWILAATTCLSLGGIYVLMRILA